VYPEDIENALRVAGVRDSIVLETKPGRIEAIILAPLGADAGAPSDDVRSAIDASVRAANARLGANQHIAAWRLWPESDFPRTHTLKVRRTQVRDWAAVDAPLPVTAG
jgi:long-chain acyl-CoA synthetase